MKRMLFALLALASISTPATAQYINGNKLSDMCKEDKTLPMCSGYIMGVSDAMELFDALMKRSPCVPEHYKLTELLALVQPYLATHKDERALAGAFPTIMALRGAFGCGPWLNGITNTNADQ